jgi:CDP-diacylglycerol---glycerol-3-phosphate 3-phosphatidyltransferase
MSPVSGPEDASAATARPAPSIWNIANALTMVRLLLVPVFGALLLYADGTSAPYRLGALAVFLVATVTDSIDGDLARRRGLVTDFGTVIDPIADKALVGMALIGLSLVGVIAWWVTIVVLTREVGITALRFVVIRHGVMPAGRGGKVKTLLQVLALGLLILPLWTLPFEQTLKTVAYGVLAAAVVVTVATGVDYVVKANRLRHTSPRALARIAARAEARVAAREAGRDEPSPT